MLRNGKQEDAVWMVIDVDVVPGRLVEIVAAADAPSGYRCRVRYSGSDGYPGGVVRSCYAENVFANHEHKQAKRAAGTEEAARAEPAMVVSN